MDIVEGVGRAYKSLFSGISTKDIPRKYLNPKSFCGKYLNFVKVCQKNGCKSGVDFGCGIGLTTVIAQLMGIKITGIDINGPLRRSPYVELQDAMAKSGYPIITFNTREFPWPIDAETFDCVIAMYSLGKDSSGIEREPDWIDNRIGELCRVCRSGALWIGYPDSHARLFMSSAKYAEANKSKNFRVYYDGIVHRGQDIIPRYLHAKS